MTNDELDKAIDTAAKHCGYGFGKEELSRIMIAHLKELLEIQKVRAHIDEKEKPE